MAPKVQRSAPPFMQITSHYRQQILDGVVPQDGKLPSIRDIAKEWGVASATASKAIKQLQSEGYARSTTQGTVADLRNKLTKGSDRLQMMRATGSGLRSGERTEILSAELVPAPDHVATALQVPEGTDVVERRRVYRDDQGVITLSTSWLSGDLVREAPELVVAEPLPKMTFGLIEERTGRRTVHRRDVVAIMPAPAESAEILEVATGTPMLTMTNHYWDQDGNPTEYARDFLGSGRELSAEYPMD